MSSNTPAEDSPIPRSLRKSKSLESRRAMGSADFPRESPFGSPAGKNDKGNASTSTGLGTTFEQLPDSSAAPSIFYGSETVFRAYEFDNNDRLQPVSGPSASVQITGQPFVPRYTNAISGLRQHSNVMAFAERPPQAGLGQHSNVMQFVERPQQAGLNQHANVMQFAERPQPAGLNQHANVMQFAERPQPAGLTQHANVMQFAERPQQYTSKQGSSGGGGGGGPTTGSPRPRRKSAGEHRPSMRDASFSTLVAERGDSPERLPKPTLPSLAERMRQMKQARRRSVSDPLKGVTRTYPITHSNAPSPQRKVTFVDDVRFKRETRSESPVGASHDNQEIGKAMTTDEGADDDSLNETTPPRFQHEQDMALYLAWKEEHSADDGVGASE